MLPQVVVGALARREGLAMEQAEAVARLLDGGSLDVRDAVRAAGLPPGGSGQDSGPPWAGRLQPCDLTGSPDRVA